MLAKAEVNFIKSLQDKKERQKHKLFIAEGPKVVNELINSLCKPYKIYAVNEGAIFNKLDSSVIQLVSDSDMSRISSLKSTRNCIGIFHFPEFEDWQSDVIFALDAIQDPGNLGTIIRIADWYGVKQLFCSFDTVDCFNSKTVQSSMASIGRVQVNYVDLKDYLSACKKYIYAAELSGQSVYGVQWQKPCIILIGNEGKGVNPELLKMAHQFIHIPRIGQAESLNAAIATAIIADHCCGIK